MRHRRNTVGAVAAVTLMLAGGTACGTDDGDSEIQPTGATETAPSEDEAVEESVKGYFDAVYDRGDRSFEEAMGEVVVPSILDTLVSDHKKRTRDDELVWTGSYTLTTDSVTVSGEEAEYRGCLDASEVQLVTRESAESGEITESFGSGGVTELTYTLERVDGAWLVAEPRGTGDPC